ncbi:HSPB1-associated protein 1 [Topomyia yanbarensis]|uniref:HSPB1-associated protein 1 n=1 Tax=Topomyia yanbarensis TaxID=2498891 RepID=UPI00273C7854|nr:HSPB1-associated protein 1 [Topomyia yanbarensis]
METSAIKDVILNTRKPVVLKNLDIPWNCFQQTLNDWLSCLDDSNASKSGFRFDCGSLRNGFRPQWERSRGTVNMSMINFYRDASTKHGHFKDNWASYSYRCIQELPKECRAGIDYGMFGFSDIGEDVSFWIGSEGAHTPCHYDTYGCNIVVQTHGRKSWLLFPPEAKLQRTRVPYEESSVYCEENFYSPAAYSSLIGVENDSYHVILEPGMVLVVPPKWWHYVETLECSVNFNTWIQLEIDTEEHISECLTRLIVQDYSKNLSAETLRHVFNPNELTKIDLPTSSDLQTTLQYLLDKQEYNKRQRQERSRYSSNYLSQNELEQLLSNNTNYIASVKKLDNHEFFCLMKTNSHRYDTSFNRSSDDEEENVQAENAINRACHPDQIQLMKNSLRV